VEPYEQFAEVYSISDLHLTVGDHVDTVAADGLARTVQALADRAAALRTGSAALVVNGDTVDFLDIKKEACFDPLGAPAKLRDAFRDNAGFWTALEKFATVGTVVLTLGNHDIELAMPTCRAMLRARIGGRLVLAFEGAGYRCRIGETNAFFVHGNDEDEWNTIDHDRLARVAAAVAAGVRHEQWEPNEGTRLVIEVLNKQKQDHPFIDYVKPEKPWLLELVAKLGFGGLARQYAEVAPRRVSAIARYAVRGQRRALAYLGDGEASSDPEQPATLFDGDELLLQAHRRHRAGERVLDSDAGAGTLGLRDLLRRKPARDDEIRAHILSSLAGDTTFVAAQGDATFRALDRKLGPDIHWIVCGHTHLRRALREGGRAYFNSGTWMRLLALYPPTFAGEFAKVLAGLNATTRQELDRITWSDNGVPRPLVLREPTVVILRATDFGGEGWLADGASPRPAVPAAPVPAVPAAPVPAVPAPAGRADPESWRTFPPVDRTHLKVVL
jgi:UDP-2,3-diacylglucosamine pyrophosphatase LpxH